MKLFVGKYYPVYLADELLGVLLARYTKVTNIFVIQLTNVVESCFVVGQDCNNNNKFAWTNNDALSCSDGIPCTKNDHCSNGVCSGTPFSCLQCEECHNDACRVKPGYCVINEGGTRQCFNHGVLRPGHQCQVIWLASLYLS